MSSLLAPLQIRRVPLFASDQERRVSVRYRVAFGVQLVSRRGRSIGVPLPVIGGDFDTVISLLLFCDS